MLPALAKAGLSRRW